MATINGSGSSLRQGGGAAGAGGAGAGKAEWPQSLKEFANRVFSASTDANRAIVQEELRSLIYKSYTEGTINSTNWAAMELQSLKSGQKKKQFAQAQHKQETPSKKKRTILADASDILAEQEKKEKRARRFDREREEHNRAEEESIISDMGASSMSTGGSLASRLGGVRPLMNIHNQAQSGFKPAVAGPAQQQTGWTYDYVGETPIAGAPSALSGRFLAPGQASSSSMSSVNSMHVAPVTYSDVEVADPNVIDWDMDTVVGLSTKLEKPYLRLTSAPDPRNVRTLATLMKTLELLKKKWRSEANYSYICDQFKSLRQDLTVQRIKNDFTVKVYEIHARIALEKGDLGEYNQCQSQLRGLYALGLNGSTMEFLAYRILYLLHTRNRREVNALMAELTPSAKAEPAVKHALAVRSALATSNFHAFFRLYDDAPNMNAYIIDHFIDRERVNALVVMSRCFRPSLALSFITTELAFTDVSQTHKFLTAIHAAIYVEPKPTPTTQTSKKHGKATVPLEQRQWNGKEAQAGLDQARKTHRTVDIKGQI